MKNYDQFHDGSLDGLLIEQASVQVFLSASWKQPFVLAVSGVVALTAEGFKAGNIIFEVLMKESAELTLQDIVDVYELSPGEDSRNQTQKFLEKAQGRDLILVEINPSYGASCIILAESAVLLHRQEWTDRTFFSGSS